jgi:hypothetical protein
MHTLATTALAAGWIDTGRNLGTNLESLLLTVGVPLMATFSVLVVWVKTRSAPAAIVAVVLAAIVSWGAVNMDTLSSKTGQDVNSNSHGSISTVVGGALSTPGSGSATGAGLR